MKKFDMLVIGGGSAGVACSRRAASYGKKVALFEYKRLGGTCVNVGCVPKKVMFNAAEVAANLSMAREYGFLFENKRFNYQTLVRKRDDYVEKLNGLYAKKLNDLNVEVLFQKAKLLPEKIIESEGEKYTAETIVIASGGEPNVLDIPGKEYTINSDDFFNNVTKVPKKAAVIGGGYIGVELSGVLNALGSEVTLICRREKVLHGFDQMLRDALMAQMKEKGVKFQMKTNLARVEEKNEVLNIVTKDGNSLKGFDMVLTAIGRHSLASALGAETAGLKLDGRGNIVTDKWDETNTKGVYALGDVNGKVMLTPVAVAAGRVLADRLFGGMKDKIMDYKTVPSVIFSHPVIATVGLSESEAKKEFGDKNIKTYTSAFVNMFYAVSAKKPKTKYKLVCKLPEEKVVGLHLLGTASDEIMQGFAVAIKMGATKKDFDNCVAIHPTASEEIVTMM